ncbi:hypothetical protein [Ktedonospora formicarum]|uniref:hypothetical protein n=1 Tax=Ktedonospora formicarum TaxID=2778364 RepID=UPI003B75D1F4
MVPVSQTFHWSRAGVSGVCSISLLLCGLLGVPVGYIVDRYEARLLMMLGSLLGGGTPFGFALSQTSWQFALLYQLICVYHFLIVLTMSPPLRCSILECLRGSR